MKILQINSSDLHSGGGGAVAMHRLHSGLKLAGIDSRILCALKTTTGEDSDVIPYWSERLEFHLSRWMGRLGLNDVHALRSFKIKDHPFYREADVLQFHILHSGYFSYLALGSLTRERPAVYTLHDMWSFTGHCTYSYDCARWKTGCGRCPHLDVYPKVSRDATSTEWKWKRWSSLRARLTIVSPSRWLAGLVADSFLNRFPVHCIPHGIDCEAYQPADQRACREALGIPVDRKVLLFGAEKLNDPRKGGDLLVQALSGLPASLKSGLFLLFFGNEDADSLRAETGIPAMGLGYVSADRLKSAIYSAADLLLFPSRADNMPLIVLESIACGTPVVAFSVGGVPEMVRPRVTGYLAAPFDTGDFRAGVTQLLEDRAKREQMSQQCRRIALDEYSLDLQVRRYAELYRTLLPAGAV